VTTISLTPVRSGREVDLLPALVGDRQVGGRDVAASLDEARISSSRPTG
jgi:hypothetical protein